MSTDIEKQLQLFRKFHAAAGADRYRITSKWDDPPEGTSKKEAMKKTFVIGKRAAIERGEIEEKDAFPGFTPEEIEKNFKKIAYEGSKNDRGIYICPLSSQYYYILIDDVNTLTKMENIKNLGLTPCYVGSSSPGNFQYLLKIRAYNNDTTDPVARRAAIDLSIEWNKNQKCGDSEVHNSVQAFRMPGFFNNKPKHRIDGKAPEVHMHRVDDVICRVSQFMYDDLAKIAKWKKNQQKSDHTTNTMEPDKKKATPIRAEVKEKKAAPVRAESEDLATLGDWAPSGLRYQDVFAATALEILMSSKMSMKPKPEGRLMDLAVAARLCAMGYSQIQTAKVVAHACLWPELRSRPAKPNPEPEWDYGTEQARCVFQTTDGQAAASRLVHKKAEFLRREKNHARDFQSEIYEKSEIPPDLIIKDEPARKRGRSR